MPTLINDGGFSGEGEAKNGNGECATDMSSYSQKREREKKERGANWTAIKERQDGVQG